MEKEIKCHLCNGKAKLKFEELKLDNGRITIKESPYYKCSKCKEEFATSGQMQELSNQINTKFVFKRPIINAGRSLAITLPSDIVQYYKLKKGEKIQIIPKNQKELKVIVQ
ncbi:AbrB/MazE/SpoVT family DNA-binding domain-containing protein [Candidatus Micrarchaeota archaeon]|nr:AbrB/MazE/SpoVT family DNA-binding domain-containing protein [Candidatus Micrarchaeota archaeon]MBU1930448.1 AbrB/MazE/SpoVT family DNA-binding domain-containing protein [Candidatus Micrarchaeota archaeon]